MLFNRGGKIMKSHYSSHWSERDCERQEGTGEWEGGRATFSLCPEITSKTQFSKEYVEVKQLYFSEIQPTMVT